MSEANSTPTGKPSKPYPDFPLTPHATRRWCKKIKGKLHYFGGWADPDGALREYQDFLAGKPKPSHSVKADDGKPAKPYPEFPLTAHPVGQWCKKIRGKVHYFGSWDDPDGALTKYNEQKDALHSGRKPRNKADPNAFTVKDAANQFLTAKKNRVDSGELSPRTMIDYKAATDLIIEQFGKHRIVADLGPDDFAELRTAISAKWGFLRVRDFIVRVRGVFKYALEKRKIDKPMDFGPDFKPPTAKNIRKERAKKGKRDFTADELRTIIDAAPMPLKGMLWLAINCGYGNADCGLLPLSAVDLKSGWVSFPRPKTGIDRRCPLWQETVDALREAIAQRPEPKKDEHKDLVFLTRTGDSWHKLTHGNPVGHEMRKLLDKLKIGGKRNFYALRRTFETVGGASRDQVAVDYLMGHAPATDDMAAVYRQSIEDDRLKAVVAKVHDWLAPAPTSEPRNVLPLSKAN